MSENKSTIDKLLNNNSLRKSTTNVVKNGKIIKNVPCYIDENGKAHFNIKTACSINNLD